MKKSIGLVLMIVAMTSCKKEATTPDASSTTQSLNVIK